MQQTSFGYDARGRLASKADGTGTTTYGFDPDNNLTNIGENGQSLQQNFDAYDRLSSYTDVNGYTIQYRRDANGNVTNLIYPGNRPVNYYYDSNNRLTNVTDWAGRQTSFTYDVAGHMTGVVRPNHTLRTMGYDDDGELTNIVERTTDQFPIAFYTLHYNPAGRIDWEFKGPLPTNYTAPTRMMTFDQDNRLKTLNGNAVTVDADGNMTYGPGTNNTFGTNMYDARNELISAGGVSYGYDPSGTRASTWDGANSMQFVTDPRTSQVLMRVKNPASTNLIFAETIYPGICGLFLHGTLPMGLNTGSMFTLAGFTGALEALNGNWTCYFAESYGGGNYLVDFLEDIGVNSSTNQSGVLIYPPASSAATSYYVSAPGIGLLYEVDETSTTTTVVYYHSDIRGSTIALTDVNGNLTDQFEYSPYGTTTYHAGTNTTPFLFNGQFGVQTDPNGLLYMRARYYNPYISRFLHADPSGFAGGLNFYAFCNDNPISLEDPFGLNGWTPDANQAQNYWMGVAVNGATSGGIMGNLQATGASTMTSFIGFFGAQNVQNHATISGAAAGNGNTGTAVLYGAATAGDIGLAALAGWTGGGGAAAKGVGLSDVGWYELGSQTINGDVYGALNQTADKVQLGQSLVDQYGLWNTITKSGELSPTWSDWAQTLPQGPTPGSYVGNLLVRQAAESSLVPSATSFFNSWPSSSSSTGK